MKICDDHWLQLRKAIDDRGLGPFVAKNEEHAADNLMSQIRGTNTKENYDPLMSATYMIWSNALESFGMGIIQSDAPCPLCLLDKHVKECTEATCNKQTGTDWIGFAADGQIEEARQLGLLGEPN